MGKSTGWMTFFEDDPEEIEQMEHALDFDAKFVAEAHLQQQLRTALSKLSELANHKEHI